MIINVKSILLRCDFYDWYFDTVPFDYDQSMSLMYTFGLSIPT